VVSSERAEDGGPRLQFASEESERNNRAVMATGGEATLNPTAATSLDSWPRELLCRLAVKLGLYGQRAKFGRELVGSSMRTSTKSSAESPICRHASARERAAALWRK
jgi:hypothetical protein